MTNAASWLWRPALLALLFATDFCFPAAAAGFPPQIPTVPHDPFILSTADDADALAAFPAELLNIVREAAEVRVFRFAPIDEFSSVRSVAAATLSEVGVLSPQSVQTLRQRLFSAESYQPGLGVSRRFAPTYGFRFTGKSGEAWWIVAQSRDLAVGMLVAKDTEWRRSPSLVIRAPAAKALQGLRK